MAADGGTVELTYKAKIDQLDRDMSSLRAKVGRHADDAGDDFSHRFTSKMNGLGSRMHGIGATIGKGLALGIAGAAVGVGAFMSNAIGASSDLSESLSKSNTIFGENAKEMEKWAATGARSFGQSKQQALENAASFGNMFTQLGIGSGTAKDMSKSMVELASDFASFHNADISEVLIAQQAAFRGEYDAVQRFVPTINAAAVEQKALKMGLAGSTKELTAQHKALATQALLMEGAGAAMGDYDRTSKGWANRMREMKARWEDFKASAGAPIMGAALKSLDAVEAVGKRVAAGFALIKSGYLEGNVSEKSGFLGGLVTVGIKARETVDFIRNAFAAGRADTTWLDTLVGGLRAFIGAFQNASDGITSSGFAGKMEAIAIFVRQNLQPVLIGLGVALALLIGPWFALGAALVYAYSKFEGFRDVVNAVVSTVVAIVSGFVDLVSTMWAQFGDQLIAYAKGAWTAISGVVEGAMNIIRGIVLVVTSLIHGDWSGAWDGIKAILSGAVKALVGLIEGGMQMFNAAMSAGIEIALGVVRGIPGAILSALGNLAGLLYDAGRAVISGLLNGIKDAVAGVYNFVSGIAGKIASLKGPIEKDRKLLTPAGKAIMDGLVAGLRAHEGHLVRQLAHVTGLVESVDGSSLLSQAAGSYGATFDVSTMGHSADTGEGGRSGSSDGARPIQVGPFYGVRQDDLPTEIPRRLRGALHLWS